MFQYSVQLPMPDVVPFVSEPASGLCSSRGKNTEPVEGTHSPQADLFTGLEGTAELSQEGYLKEKGRATGTEPPSAAMKVSRNLWGPWDSSAAAHLGFHFLELLATDVVATTHNDHNGSQGQAQVALSLEFP